MGAKQTAVRTVVAHNMLAVASLATGKRQWVVEELAMEPEGGDGKG